MSLPALEEVAREQWQGSEINPGTLNKLIERIPRLCQAVIKAKVRYI